MGDQEAAKAHELPWQEREAAELRAELHLMKTAGIIEVAVRNPSVADYMAHWEGRATAAEAALTALREDNEHMKKALDEKEIASGLTSDWNLWRYWAEQALSAISICHDAEVRATAAETEAATLRAMLEEAAGALEPFSEIAGEMFARNWQAGRVVIALDCPEKSARVYFKDFIAARAISAKIKEKSNG